MRKAVFIIFILMLISVDVFASQEGVLKISKFTVESNGIGNSGPVKIVGEQNQQNEFVSLEVEAFGRKYKIANEDLKKLPRVAFNGIQFSFEEGYKELGGKTIYIVFQLGFTSGVKKQSVLSLTESNKVKVEEVEMQNLR